jgi:chromosome segregation ATPase
MAVVKAFVLVALAWSAAYAEDPERPSLEDYEAEQEAKANATAGALAKESKEAALKKVTAMLQTLKGKVLEEGEKEAATYNKFACFCKDTTAEKVASVSAGQDEKETLESQIVDLQTERDELDTKIAEIEEEIEAAEKEMKEAQEEREKEAAIYAKNEADLKAALEALEGAIQSLKASKGASLLQMQAVGKNVKAAVLLADILGIGGPKTHHLSAMFLQQSPDVPTEDYKFHSDEVITTLEGLEKDFRAEKVEVDEAEVKAISAHESFMQEKTDFVKQQTIELDETREEKSQKVAEIAEKSQELTTVAATLLDDQQYLNELSKMCQEKGKTWDQRSSTRQDELSMITEVISIIEGEVAEATSAATVRFNQKAVGVKLASAVAKDPAAMVAIEAAAEAADGPAPLAFLQEKQSKPAAFLSAVKKHVQAAAGPEDLRSISATSRKAIAELLRTSGTKLKSTLLTGLATRIAGSEDPFAKIRQLIQELIERLMTQASMESNQKAWCDKSIGDAEQKRTYAAEKIAKLNGEMAELEALRDKLMEELETLATEIKDLKKAMKRAENQREEEKAENAATVEEAQSGLEAIEMAIDIMRKFYLTSEKATVESFAQKQGPKEDAPETFGNGEAYKGAQSDSTGIIGMMEVMQSDFQRTISETEKAEADAEQAHLEFMTETGKSLEAKETAETEKTGYKDDAVDKLESAQEDLDSQTDVLQTTLSELLELQPVCVDTAMTYEERVAAREDEIAALKKALCILAAYQEFGDGGEGTGSC